MVADTIRLFPGRGCGGQIMQLLVSMVLWNRELHKVAGTETQNPQMSLGDRIQVGYGKFYNKADKTLQLHDMI